MSAHLLFLKAIRFSYYIPVAYLTKPVKATKKETFIRYLFHVL